MDPSIVQSKNKDIENVYGDAAAAKKLRNLQVFRKTTKETFMRNNIDPYVKMNAISSTGGKKRP